MVEEILLRLEDLDDQARSGRPKTMCFKLQGLLNKFRDFFRIGTFIDSTHMKL